MCSKSWSGCATGWRSSTRASWCARDRWRSCAARARRWKTPSWRRSAWSGRRKRSIGCKAMNQARAILWAQWRTMRNYYPREGVGWGAVIGIIWYGIWAAAALACARLIANPDSAGLLKALLPGGLLIVFLYWQVVPVLMAATGASLELKKLKVYPIPPQQLFAIEVMLRVTS